MFFHLSLYALRVLCGSLILWLTTPCRAGEGIQRGSREPSASGLAHISVAGAANIGRDFARSKRDDRFDRGIDGGCARSSPPASGRPVACCGREHGSRATGPPDRRGRSTAASSVGKAARAQTPTNRQGCASVLPMNASRLEHSTPGRAAEPLRSLGWPVRRLTPGHAVGALAGAKRCSHCGQAEAWNQRSPSEVNPGDRNKGAGRLTITWHRL